MNGAVTRFVVLMVDVQENEAKRNRAEKRAADEMKARKLKEKEISELEDRLAKLKASTAKVDLKRLKSEAVALPCPAAAVHSWLVHPRVQILSTGRTWTRCRKRRLMSTRKCLTCWTGSRP